MIGRAQQIIINQPGLVRLLVDDDLDFDAQMNRQRGYLSFASGRTTAAWTDFRLSWSESDYTETTFLSGTVGAHLAASPNALAGLMVSVDRTTEDQGETEIEGTGWLIGPYFVARMADAPLYFEGRALFGQSENDIEVAGASGDFETTRQLLQARITGELPQGRTTLLPHLDYSRIEEDQDDFVTDNGLVIDDQSITLSQLTLGVDFRRPIDVTTGTLLLTGGVSAIWSSEDGDGTPSGVVTTDE